MGDAHAGNAHAANAHAGNGPTATARAVLESLVALGATHLVGLPDNGTAALFRLASQRDDVVLLTVTREGEAFAIGSGLWLGGKDAVVVVQNTGLLESGDSLRGTAMRMGVPLLILVGVRGHAKMVGNAEEIEAARRDGRIVETLRRADIDSVAPMTAPTLDAWGVPHHTYASDDDLGRLAQAWRGARERRCPVAVLLPAALE